MSCEECADAFHAPLQISRSCVEAMVGAANRQTARCGWSAGSDPDREDDRVTASTKGFEPHTKVSRGAAPSLASVASSSGASILRPASCGRRAVSLDRLSRRVKFGLGCIARDQLLTEDHIIPGARGLK